MTLELTDERISFDDWEAGELAVESVKFWLREAWAQPGKYSSRWDP